MRRPISHYYAVVVLSIVYSRYEQFAHIEFSVDSTRRPTDLQVTGERVELLILPRLPNR